jgi:serine/threonine-protein kinase HipA
LDTWQDFRAEKIFWFLRILSALISNADLEPADFPLYPQADKILEKTYVTHQRLHPLLSNLLPEGALRELIAQSLKVHIDNEFQLLAALGHDLPGALIATPLDPEEIPDEIKFKLQISNPDQILKQEIRTDNKFSLAGVQMKFSMKAKDGRFTLAQATESTLLGTGLSKLLLPDMLLFR